MAVHVTEAEKTAILQPSVLRRYGLTQKLVVKVLPLYGWLAMRQLHSDPKHQKTGKNQIFDCQFCKK